MATQEMLKRLGEQIRAYREREGMTQSQLGSRAGLGGKYISEIERGTRDVPLSTLCAIVERGLGLRLEIEFRAKNGSRPNIKLPPLPRPVEEVARLVAAHEPDDRAELLAIMRSIFKLARR
jgi:transcriptional regulator with XRE-family HTH domain